MLLPTIGHCSMRNCYNINYNTVDKQKREKRTRENLCL